MVRMTTFRTGRCLQIVEKFLKWPVVKDFVSDAEIRHLEDYRKVISQPMWLLEVESRLKNDKYVTIEDFEYDMNLIWKNAQKYNSPASLYSWYAKAAEQRFRKKIGCLSKTPEEYHMYKLQKLSSKLNILSNAMARELDHVSTASGN
jgi:hypothetical protein